MRSQGTRGLCAVAIAVAAMAALPAAASAVDRYAEPDGDGISPCAIGDPCDLEFAVEGASTNDQVILLGGVPPADPFVAPPNINVPNDVVVRGATGARPEVGFASAGVGFFLANGSVLRDIDIEFAATSTAVQVQNVTTPAVIERVFVHTTGAGAFTPCFITGAATIRDSVCWSDTVSANAYGMEVRTGAADDFTVNVRNSTLITSSTLPGMLGRTLGGVGSATVNVTNSIVRSGSGNDIQGQDLGGTENVGIVLDHSNYATEDDPGGDLSITNPGTPTNQTAAPAFVNAAAGDFHQTALSTGTLDLGTATGLLPGELDLDGARPLAGRGTGHRRLRAPGQRPAARRRGSSHHHDPTACDQEEEVQEAEEAQRSGVQEEEVQEETEVGCGYAASA